jgi:hypothetical protein
VTSPSHAAPVPWRRLPADVATALRPRLPDAVQAVADAVTAATPVFATIEDSKFDRDVRTAVQVAFERFLDLVGTEEPALPPHVREVFVALGAAEAREDRGPEALLTALRTASRQMLRMAYESLARVRPVDTGELLDLSEATSAFVDELAAASTDGYALQLREQAGEGDRRRRELAELLLRGSAPESVVAAAAAGIGWRSLGSLDGMVPVVLPPDQARDARFRYGADGVVVERARDAVLLLRAGPRAARAQLAEALQGRGAVVGPALPWQQVPEALRLAELAAELVGPVPGPTFADDHLVGLALNGEPGALAVLSSRRLAPFATVRAAQRESLLATLDAWLRHWGSRAAVSAELFVHPQTVSYRVRRLRELLGDDLDDPAARFELQLVLAARGPAAPAGSGAAVDSGDSRSTQE